MPKEYHFRFDFHRKKLKSKYICILTESSHDIVKSSLYIPRDRSHKRTIEIELNSGTIVAY